MAQIIVTEDEDYRDNLLPAGITDIVFDSVGGASATFSAGQFGAGNPISNAVTVTGDGQGDRIDVIMDGAAVFTAAGWSFVNWASFDGLRVFGSVEDESVTGSSREDFISGNGGLDILAGGSGADMFQTSAAYVYEDGSVIDGGSGHDVISAAGLAGINDLTAVAISGVEEIRLASDGGTVRTTSAQIGAAAIDNVWFSPAVSATIEIYGDSVDLTGVSFVNWNAGDAIHLFGSDFGNNSLVGSNRPDILDGVFTSSDTMNGAGGADTMQSGMGPDVFVYTRGAHAAAGESLDGGTGTDTIQLDGEGGDIDFTGVSIALVKSLTFVSGAWTARFLASQLTGGAIDIVEASAAADAVRVTAVAGTADLSGVSFILWDDSANSISLIGTAADDTLRGTLFDDFLNGGGGADEARGGPGDDTYNVNDLADTILELAGNGTDLVRSAAASYELDEAQEIENLTLIGNGDASGTGNSLDNILTGNNGDNTLDGAAGNDTINGTGGTDTLIGGDGDDTYSGAVLTGPGADTIVELDGGGNDIVRSAVTASLAPANHVERLTLTGSAGIGGTGNALANTITGNSGANLLNGANGADTLIGGGGDDTLVGGRAADLLVGGAGADVFRFAGANLGADAVNGFSAAEDRFDLAGGLFSARAQGGGNTTLTYAGGTIVVNGVTGLTLEEWNALVLPGGGGAAASALPAQALDLAAYARDCDFA